MAPARFDVSTRVILPVGLVEVDGEEPARLVEAHRVDAHRKIPVRGIVGIAPEQVIADDARRHGLERPVITRLTGDARLLAGAGDPLVAAHGRVSALAGLSALEAPCVDVIAATEEAEEELDFLTGRGVLGYGRQRLVTSIEAIWPGFIVRRRFADIEQARGVIRFGGTRPPGGLKQRRFLRP